MKGALWLAVMVGLFSWISQGSAQTISLEFVPSSQQVVLGTSATVMIKVSGLGNATPPSLSTFDLNIIFDPAILSCQSATLGDPILGDQLNLRGLGVLSAVTSRGEVLNLFELSLDSPNDLYTLQAGEFILATVHCMPLALGTTRLSLTVNTLGDALGDPLPVNVSGGSVDVVLSVALCRLNLNVHFTNSTLTLNFDLGTQEPTTWNVWLTFQDEIARLTSIPFPTIDPPIQFPITLPFFPTLGTIGVLTTLTTPAKGIICSDFITVNTGSPLAAALMAHELHGLLEPYVVEFHKQLGRH